MVTNLNETRKSQQKGITLIALIITIIVLLILAGVTIAAISGNENVLDKAQSAKSKTDIANAKEAAILKATEYIQDYYQGKFVNNDSSVTTYTTAGAYVAKQFETQTQSGNYYIKTDADSRDLKISLDVSQSNVIVEGKIEDNGTITWSDEVSQSGGGTTPGGQSGQDDTNLPEGVTKVSETTTEVTYSVTSFDKIVTSSTNEVGFLPSETNTKIVKGTGDTQQQIIVPAGFKVVAGTKLEDGMVIKDASEPDGNEFVWVPVNQTLTFADSTTGQIELARYDFGSSSSPTITAKGAQDPISTYYTENASAFNYTVDGTSYSAGASVAINIADFRSRTEAAKGYYIGRYEAGNDNNVTVCKANKPVYNNIIRGEITTTNGTTTLTGAVKEARGMYDDQDGFISDLVNSYAWDTAIVFIEKCGTKTNSSTYAFQNALTTSGPLNTAAAQDSSNNKDVQCNIYDMAGNVREWTTEHSNAVGSYPYPCVGRGGKYDNSSYYTSSRDFSRTTSSNDFLGFRPLLYIL